MTNKITKIIFLNKFTNWKTEEDIIKSFLNIELDQLFLLKILWLYIYLKEK